MSLERQKGRKSNQSQAAQATQINMKKFKCGRCRKEIADVPKKEEDESIMCSKCNTWFHRNCTSLDTDEFRILLRGKENVVYSCDGCLMDHGNEIKKLNGLEEKLVDLMNIVTNMKESILKEVDSRIEEKLESRMEEIEKNLTERLERKTEEQEERDRRKHNIIIVQLPESQNEVKEDREEDDIQAAHSILSKVTSIDVEEISKPVRIGPKRDQDGKPRLLKVTLGSTEKKEKILRSYNKCLNENVKDPNKRIYINADLTPLEREREKQLRDELKAARLSNPTKKLVIRNNKIFELLPNNPGNPGAGDPRDRPWSKPY